MGLHAMYDNHERNNRDRHPIKTWLVHYVEPSGERYTACYSRAEDVEFAVKRLAEEDCTDIVVIPPKE